MKTYSSGTTEASALFWDPPGPPSEAGRSSRNCNAKQLQCKKLQCKNCKAKRKRKFRYHAVIRKVPGPLTGFTTHRKTRGQAMLRCNLFDCLDWAHHSKQVDLDLMQLHSTLTFYIFVFSLSRITDTLQQSTK